jgi:hypothetical protein
MLVDGAVTVIVLSITAQLLCPDPLDPLWVTAGPSALKTGGLGFGAQALKRAGVVREGELLIDLKVTVIIKAVTALLCAEVCGWVSLITVEPKAVASLTVAISILIDTAGAQPAVGEALPEGLARRADDIRAGETLWAGPT